MIIGILSDSHGDVKRTIKAIKALKPHTPGHIIHCGDIGSQSVLIELATGFLDPVVPVTCVLGNVDMWESDLDTPWPHVRICGRFARLELDHNKIAVIHGDNERQLFETVQSQEFDYIFTGHTHEQADIVEGKTRIINPGALHRSREPSCAVLNLATGDLTYLSVL